MKRTTLLIDGDLVTYRSVAAAQTKCDFGDGPIASLDERQARERIDDELAWIKRELQGDLFVLFSDPSRNWRKELCSYYKANRGPKPEGYAAVRAYVEGAYHCEFAPSLEADDLLGLYATGTKLRGVKIIVSADKDMRTIPGLLFDPGHPELGVELISKQEADYNHLTQALTGDSADNYPGLPKCGPVKAAKILGDAIDFNVRDAWPRVVAAFEAKKLTVDDALLQARLARILRKGEYVNGQVRLWTPEQ